MQSSVVKKEVAAGLALGQLLADHRGRLLVHRRRPRLLEQDGPVRLIGNVDGQPAHVAEVDVVADLEPELADVEVERLRLVEDVDLRDPEGLEHLSCLLGFGFPILGCQLG